MSYDDKYFMAYGLRVRHRYPRVRKGNGTCDRCGVKRRWRSSGWEYRPRGGTTWAASNPPCVAK